MQEPSIMSAPTMPPEIFEHISQILSENERAFCIISDEFQEGAHPLPIYRVDENGKGVECGYAGVLVVKDGMVIAMIAVKASGLVTEASEGLGNGCLYYEWKYAKELKERGPYAVVISVETL